MAQAEGLVSIYYKTPSWYAARGEVTPYKIPCTCNQEAGEITFPVPLGKLIYELAVQFRTIKINWKQDPEGIEISCDAKGEFLEHWIFKDLIIKDRDHLRKLVENYQQVGKFSLLHVKHVWEDLCKRLTLTKLI